MEGFIASDNESINSADEAAENSLYEMEVPEERVHFVVGICSECGDDCNPNSQLCHICRRRGQIH